VTETTTSTNPAGKRPRIFDLSLRVDAAGPRGIEMANNLAFLARGPHYVLRRVERFPGPVVPVTDRRGSVLLLRGRAAARQMFTDNETFHRPDGVLDLPPGQVWSRMFDAVITANGSEHTRRRKLLMPAVHRTAIAHYTDVFAQTFAESRFGPDAERGVFDARAEFLRVSKVNMLRCLLGLEPTDELGELADVIVRLGGDALSPGVVAWKHDLSWTPYGRWLRRVAWAYERLAVLIEERRAQIRTTLRLIAEHRLPGLVTTEIGYGTVNGVVAGPRKPVLVDTAAAPSGRLTKIDGSVTAVWRG
jgi:cytochrome P450